MGGVSGPRIRYDNDHLRPIRIVRFSTHIPALGAYSHLGLIYKHTLVRYGGCPDHDRVFEPLSLSIYIYHGNAEHCANDRLGYWIETLQNLGVSQIEYSQCCIILLMNICALCSVKQVLQLHNNNNNNWPVPD